jgi:hypothetical protein
VRTCLLEHREWHKGLTTAIPIAVLNDIAFISRRVSNWPPLSDVAECRPQPTDSVPLNRSLVRAIMHCNQMFDYSPHKTLDPGPAKRRGQQQVRNKCKDRIEVAVAGLGCGVVTLCMFAPYPVSRHQAHYHKEISRDSTGNNLCDAISCQILSFRGDQAEHYVACCAISDSTPFQLPSTSALSTHSVRYGSVIQMRWAPVGETGNFHGGNSEATKGALCSAESTAPVSGKLVPSNASKCEVNLFAGGVTSKSDSCPCSTGHHSPKVKQQSKGTNPKLFPTPLPPTFHAALLKESSDGRFEITVMGIEGHPSMTFSACIISSQIIGFDIDSCSRCLASCHGQRSW